MKKPKILIFVFLYSILLSRGAQSSLRCEEIFFEPFEEFSLLKKSPFGGRTRYQLNYHKAMEKLFNIHEANSHQMKLKVAYYIEGRPVYRIEFAIALRGLG